MKYNNSKKFNELKMIVRRVRRNNFGIPLKRPGKELLLFYSKRAVVFDTPYQKLLALREDKMVSKTNTNGSFDGAADYLTKGKKEHEVMKAEGVRAYDKKLMISDFEDQASMNPRVRQNVLHISLSHHPNDAGKIKGREGEIIDSWLAGMKKKGIDFDKTQYAIIKHNDRAHPHYHLVANMVGNDGKRFNIDYIGLKAKDVSKQVTREYGLTIASLKERSKRQEIKITPTQKDQGLGFGI